MQAPDAFAAAMGLAMQPSKENLAALLENLEHAEVDGVEREVFLHMRLASLSHPEANGAPTGLAEELQQTHMSLYSIYCALIVAYCADGDLDNARFAMKRMPDAMKTAPEAASVIRILKLLWNREHEQFYATVAQATWPDQIKPLVGLCVELTRERMLALLAKAYSNIRASSAGKLLGMADESEVVSTLEALGWKNQDGFLAPPPADKVAIGAASGKSVDAAASWQRVQELAKIVVNLEL
ncbi:COP9 signalosome [Hyaloraphidium curvatum]|nr:COP9 signalosome [Hyaloraphidium curvatum]